MELRVLMIISGGNAYSQAWMRHQLKAMKSYITGIVNWHQSTEDTIEGIPVFKYHQELKWHNRVRKITGKKRLDKSDFLDYVYAKTKSTTVFFHFATNAFLFKKFVDRFNGKLFIAVHGHDVTKNYRVYGNDNNALEPAYYEFLQNLPKAVNFICFSETAIQLLNEVIPEGKHSIHRCYFGFDVPSNHQSKDFSVKTILFAGRFFEVKGPLESIKAVEIVAKELEGVKLVMVGDGPLLETCKQYVSQNNLETLVEFVEPLPQKDLFDLLQTIPYLTSHNQIGAFTRQRESFGALYIEAMLHNMCIVTGNVAGPSEFLNQDNAYLFEPGDINGHAKAIENALVNADVAKHKAQRANVSAKVFSREKELKSLLQVLNS